MSTYNARDPGSVPGLGRSSGEGNGNPLQYSCLEKSHGQRSVVGYSPWGCKESARLSDFTFTFNDHTVELIDNSYWDFRLLTLSSMSQTLS